MSKLWNILLDFAMNSIKIKIFTIIMLLAIPSFSFAGEKEELNLKKQLLEERIARIEAQGQYLQMLHIQTQQELAEVKNKIKLLPVEGDVK